MGLTQIARHSRRLGLAVIGLLASFSTALAQVPAPPPSAPIVVQGRGLALEWGITILMIGLALFVVCRSSNRN
jgi:hypothetical protein